MTPLCVTFFSASLKVCSAEKELNVRSPVQLKHGKVMEKGASGFNGWTQGLRRTNNPAVLKRMYKAKRPAQVVLITALTIPFIAFF